MQVELWEQVGAWAPVGVTWPPCPLLGQGAEPWLTAAIRWVAVGTVRLVQLTGKSGRRARTVTPHPHRVWGVIEGVSPGATATLQWTSWSLFKPLPSGLHAT